MNLLQAGIDAIADKPLFGHGFGVTLDGQSNVLQLGAHAYSDIANFPLTMAVETGLAGALILLAVVAVTATRMARSPSWYDRAVFVGIVAALMTSLGVTALSVTQLLFLLLGLFGRRLDVAVAWVGRLSERDGGTWWGSGTCSPQTATVLWAGTRTDEYNNQVPDWSARTTSS